MCNPKDWRLPDLAVVLPTVGTGHQQLRELWDEATQPDGMCLPDLTATIVNGVQGLERGVEA
jgi:hypothetical protein